MFKWNYCDPRYNIKSNGLRDFQKYFNLPMYNLRHIEWVEVDSPLDFFMKRQFKLLPAVIFCVCVDIKAMENEK